MMSSVVINTSFVYIYLIVTPLLLVYQWCWGCHTLSPPLLLCVGHRAPFFIIGLITCLLVWPTMGRRHIPLEHVIKGERGEKKLGSQTITSKGNFCTAQLAKRTDYCSASKSKFTPENILFFLTVTRRCFFFNNTIHCVWYYIFVSCLLF